MKHNVIYCNTKKDGFIAVELQNGDLIFADIPAVNDNIKEDKEHKTLWNLVKDMTAWNRRKLRREILGKGDCPNCGGWRDYLGNGRWGCEDCDG